MSKRLVVREIIGRRYAITLDDGQKLFEEIKAALKQDEPVVVDFSDISIFASPFLNAAIGQLYGHFTPEQLDQRLHIPEDSMTPVGRGILIRVVENAKEYYTTPSFKEAVDRAIDSPIEED